ncbi:pentatricopeptide repeat-containing protein At4g33990-like [Coffea arabica]|uniref:Pentatricopeptide repeat-containing protein At4g33990-like n=1 Tax=Coffea arabica TaxID=13443 RepID=A0A6P6WKT8_COFAR|nr:pentatricopeptide repeat-containing protein At4g33990-like [Coffea arabica]XP_027115185.1 pentatricopeptide repeat-containing protein At4g33990-like [Coffea arabica]XP_027115186.1 pentatricopeptide repeat-containing protein At4g33990-like [Coffea arabica]XP_027115187.1 pentatricopeptide repeat-containing protein At4g33990-like [Coffea arabica]XP_027115188.1 pentatricopeptide repeat-containing protein At4g33990-like [Coffea arabica]XP_027115189.1 pentatricopeptide repeat-containing protein A
MSSLLRNARELFVKIPKRISLFRTSTRALLHNSSWQNHSSLQELDVSVEDENVVSWTAQISHLERENQPEQAIGLFKTMLMRDQKPNFVTVLSVIRAIGQLGSKNMASMIHGFAIKLGCDSELPLVTGLLGAYSSGWDIGAVRILFALTPNKDVILWSAMVSACVKNEEYVEALNIFRKMQSCGVQPNRVSIVTVLPACANLGTLWLGKEIHGFSIKRDFYSHINLQNSLVDMYAKCRLWSYSVQVSSSMQTKDVVSWRSMICGSITNESPARTLILFSQMRSSCVEVDVNTVRVIIVASSQLEEIKVGLGLHGLALKMGYVEDISLMTAILQMYANFGEIGSAKTLFDYLDNKDLIAWSAMIAAYVQNEQPFDAFKVYRQMQSAGEKPNEVTFLSLLQSCSSMTAQEIGESIHAYLLKAGYMLNAFVTSALIDMYCKFGRTRQGVALFDENHSRDLVCWSSMINGYGINGLGEEALHCFSNMLHCGVKPNDVVFISLLAACSHCGLEYEGWSWFYAMGEKFGITPKLAHYACMVDMLSRQGNVEEAFEFVKKMPINPDKRIWGAILAGCRETCGSSEVSEIAARQLLSLDPENASYHVFLSNLYAEQGRWKEAAKLRELVDSRGLKKEIGHSMI